MSNRRIGRVESILDVIWLSSFLWFLIRVALVQSADGRLPFQSANDRSRWCTIRALVDFGTYQIDEVITDRGWDTIDKVAHPGPDGALHYYSSKPTLYPTLLAGMYWLIQQLSGWRLDSQPFLVARCMVALVNGACLWVYWLTLRGMICHWSGSPGSRIFVALAAAWGTPLSAFAITLNNHLPAAAATMLVLWCLWQMETSPSRSVWLPFTCGLAAGFAADNELPALALLAGVAVYLSIDPVAVPWGITQQSVDGKESAGNLSRLDARSHLPRRMQLLCLFLIGASLVLVAGRVTNWFAHGDLWPPYAHRLEGADWQSGNWYVYPGSYWLPENRRGIDVGEPSRAWYLWHVLVGHHGWFSLTPMWLLALRGFGSGIWSAIKPGFRRPLQGPLVDAPRHSSGDWRPFARLLILGMLLFLICLCFYVARPLGDRNYGGMSIVFRWLLWQTPFWLLALLAVSSEMDRSRTVAVLAWLLLALSVASAAYGWFRPWQHPWLYALFRQGLS